MLFVPGMSGAKVEKRGVEQESATFAYRHPRTVVMSKVRVGETEVLDRVMVLRAGQLVDMPASDFRPEMVE